MDIGQTVNAKEVLQRFLLSLRLWNVSFNNQKAQILSDSLPKGGGLLHWASFLKFMLLYYIIYDVSNIWHLLTSPDVWTSSKIE